MPGRDRPLVWLRGEVRSPPFSTAARLEAGCLLREMQRGVRLGMPHVRPIPRIGARCHELRVQDASVTWRLIFRLDEDAVVILDVFGKKTRRIPDVVVVNCRDRLRRYDATIARGGAA